MTGAEIEEIRKELGLTQTQFASMLGAHAVTVSRWESDLLHPTPYQLGLLHRFRSAMVRAKKSKHRVADEVAVALVTAGAIAGLYLLLRWAFDDSDTTKADEPIADDSENEKETVHPVPKHGARQRRGKS